MNDLFEKLAYFLMFIPILSFHECAHAWAAHLLGDDTAKNEGRMTLNPISHIDPIGTLLFPLMSVFFDSMMIGWGRPVPVDNSNFRNIRRDDSLVALAGPASNIVLAAVALFAGSWLPQEDRFRLLAAQFAQLSIFLAVFNLIPIPPLDGWHVVKHLFRIPEEVAYRSSIVFLIILLVLINFGPFRNFLFAVSNIILNGVASMVGFHLV